MIYFESYKKISFLDSYHVLNDYEDRTGIKNKTPSFEKGSL